MLLQKRSMRYFSIGAVGIIFLSGVYLYTMYFIRDTTPVVVPDNPLYLDTAANIDSRIDNLLSYMTLEEKIGQMALVEKSSLIKEEDISRYNLGGLLSGAGSKPAVNTPVGWRDMVLQYQNQAKKSRLGIPLLYGADAVHGHGNIPGATVFPHAVGFGASRNVSLVEEIAQATAMELRATKINWSFSPTLDVPRDIRWGRAYETFSDDPAVVATLGTAYLRGLQTFDSTTTSQTVAVLGTLKHYIGLGGMGWNTSSNENYKIDQGITLADESYLRTEYLPPFQSAVEVGALSVMVGLNTWGDEKIITNKYLLTDVLKGELEFKGFVVSDWYGVHEGRRNKFLATVEGVNAGVDMLMLPFNYQTFVRHMKWANQLGLISDARIDDAVRRILRAKFALGLFDESTTPVPMSVIGSAEHRALARQAVAESLVLLKNEGGILPIQPSVKTIAVAGSAADNVGRQSGGWTIDWQGIDGDNVPGATSILSGIESAAGPGVTIDYDLLGKFSPTRKKFDIGIAVVGEKPYAEGWGDTQYPILGDDDLQTIKNLQAVSRQVVVVLVSGRPLLIAREIESWDALVTAWLPGS